MERPQWDELISPKADLLVYQKKGVLWVKNTPVYIVELTKEQDIAFVQVFKVHPGTEKAPKKLAVEDVKKVGTFSNNSILGRLANNFFPAKTVKKWAPKPPAFTAPVVHNQINTFTGQRESGFFEREEDRMSPVGGEIKFIRGNNTGVFIGLSSIVWEDKVTIPTKSLVETLLQHQHGDGFYDFTGNDNKKDNPLSSNYTGGN
ncbi:hypothetical protein CPT_Mater102 [Bacillus phage Mater]|uniref:Uncharacterized protein n=1 Tax=Bacillus phage Mater TaxID=1540090 RepID=A0A0A0RNP1_9CAUD|nr:hypothetical protein CPT_Mater102 [Bacillus phage Mater]AIW03259.1 hypothetical protein CPT_Mater102 [Bacillus phage Mater]